VVMMLAPETNGHVAVKAWRHSASRRREHTHLQSIAKTKDTLRDIQAQPRKIISSPTWSGIESETVSYNAGYTNVHELIPCGHSPGASSSIRIIRGYAPSARRWPPTGRLLI